MWEIGTGTSLFPLPVVGDSLCGCRRSAEAAGEESEERTPPAIVHQAHAL